MSQHAGSNRERTAAYLEKFDRRRTLTLLIDEPAPVIIDVGANTGSSLDEFRTWWPGAEVHCFEPQAECWDELLAAASRLGRTVVNTCALGSQPAGDVPFYTHDSGTGQAGFHRVNLSSADSINLRTIAEHADDAGLEAYRRTVNHERRVSVRRLDEYLGGHQIARVHVLKLDTQGAEPEILAGCGDRLRDVDVVVSELMFYDYYERQLSFSDLEQHLHPAGLRLYDISHISKNPMNGRTDWVDVIYVHDRVVNRRHRA